MQRRKLGSFLWLPLADKKKCLALKKSITPLQSHASLIQQAAGRLKKAISEADHAGMTQDIKVTTPEQAFLTELMILTEDTPRTRLISAIRHAKEVAGELLNLTAPALSASETIESLAGQDNFAYLVRDSHRKLSELAQSLFESAQQQESNLAQGELIAKLDKMKKESAELQAILDERLETISGVSMSDSDEALAILRTKISKSWQIITNIEKKIAQPYSAAQYSGRSNKNEQQLCIDVHRAVLPLLNETEKLRIACQQLEMALNAKGASSQQLNNAVETAAEKCKTIVDENIFICRKELNELFKKHDVPLNQLVQGEALSTTLGTELDQQAAELFKVIDTLQHTSWYAQWVPHNKKGKALDILNSLQNRLTSIKANIKNVVAAGTGNRPHNNPLQGMIAKDAGEWLVALKNTLITTNPELSQAERDSTIEKMVNELVKQFTTQEDPEGALFRVRVELAIRDAEKGEIPWPLTPEQHLAMTKTQRDYTLAWAEKRLTYGILFNSVFYHSLMPMFSLVKNTAVSPLRLINLALMPASKEIKKRAIKKVRPGEPRPTAALEEYSARENYQTAFRLMSTISPQLLKTVASSAILTYGLIKDEEYRDGFLSRALSRVPEDLFWVGTFTGGRLGAEAYQMWGNSSQVTDNDVQEQPQALLSRPGNHVANSTEMSRNNALTEVLAQKSAVKSWDDSQHNRVGRNGRPLVVSENTVEDPAEVVHKRGKRHIQHDDKSPGQLSPEAIAKESVSINVIDSTGYIREEDLPLILDASLNNITDAGFKEKFRMFYNNALKTHSTQEGKANVDTYLSIINALIDDYEANKKTMSIDQYAVQFRFGRSLWDILNKTSIPDESVSHLEEIATRLKPWLDTSKTGDDEAAMRKLGADLDKIAKEYQWGAEEKKDIDSLLAVIKQQQKIIGEYEIKFGKNSYSEEKQEQLDQYIFEAGQFKDKDSRTKVMKQLYQKPEFTYTSDPRGDGYATVESQIAGNLVKSVYWYQNDHGHTATYGYRYEAEKALLTSLLAARKINNLDQLPATWYKGDEAERITQLLLTNFCEQSETQRSEYIRESAELFYSSFRRSVLGDSTLDIKGLEKKPLSSYNNNDKAILFEHYLQQPMDFEYNQPSDLERFLKASSFFMMIRSFMNVGSIKPARSPFLSKKGFPLDKVKQQAPKKLNVQATGKKTAGNIKTKFDKGSGRLTITSKRSGLTTKSDWASYRVKVGEEIKQAISNHPGAVKITVNNRLNKIGKRLSKHNKKDMTKPPARKPDTNTRPQGNPNAAPNKGKIADRQSPIVGEEQTTVDIHYTDNSGYGQLSQGGKNTAKNQKPGSSGNQKAVSFNKKNVKGNSASAETHTSSQSPQYAFDDEKVMQKIAKGKVPELSDAAQKKYNDWKNAIVKDGMDPVTAAKRTGDMNPEKLHGGGFSIRLSQVHRVTYIIENKKITILTIGGHYTRQRRELNEDGVVDHTL